MTSPLLRARVGPAPVWCSSRAHGNVGDHVGDDPEAAVAANRARVASLAGLPDPAHVGMAAPGARHRGVRGHVDARSGSRPLRRRPRTRSVTARRGSAARDRDRRLRADRPRGRRRGCGRARRAPWAARRHRRSRCRRSCGAIGSGAVHAFLGPCIRPAHYEFGADDLDASRARFGPECRRRDERQAGPRSTSRPRCASRSSRPAWTTSSTAAIDTAASSPSTSRTGATARPAAK